MIIPYYNYILIIAEKPKAANRIAKALSTGSIIKRAWNKVPFWIINVEGRTCIVASAVGHLFTLTTDEDGVPVFSYHWVPVWSVDKSASYTKPYYMLLEKLCRRASIYINACDYDVEGSVIGYMIIKHFGDLRRAYRMKFSTLTSTDLRRAFHRLEKLDWPMIEAGLCRHELDWLWGINVSRVLIEAVRKVSGRRIILSAGRVQSPTLAFMAKKEIGRRLNIPKPQPAIEVKVKIGDKEYSIKLEKPRPKTLEEARKIAQLIKKYGYLIITQVSYKTELIHPPPPFNLGDLQAEASRIYGYSPLRTQEIAEQLYLDALISYPRTNSQKLPPAINYREILMNIAKNPTYSRLARTLLIETRGQLKPKQGAKEDPAHPAIYPTGNLPGRLPIDRSRIYDLIVRRFFACFSKPAKISQVKVKLESPFTYMYSRIEFSVNFTSIIDQGWIKYYPYVSLEAVKVPYVYKYMRIPVSKVRVRVQYVSPIESYTKTKIVKWMESVNIGTEATRARILETLFQRKYLITVGKQIRVTDLGLVVYEVLSKYFKDITDVALSRKFEIYMDEIRRGIRSRTEVVNEAKKVLLKLINEYKANVHLIGEDLTIGLGLGKATSKCKLCSRRVVENGLCNYHLMALNEVKRMYEVWKEVLGISWNEYLNKLLKLKGTGDWIRDVVKYLSSHRV